MKKRRILIIDDDQDLVESVKAALEETGRYEVESETISSQGVLKARSYHPDLILLDVIMPEVAGNEVARRLQRDPKTKDIPVTYFTVIVSHEEVSKHSGLIGGNRFVAKPVSVDELTRCIEETLDENQ